MAEEESREQIEELVINSYNNNEEPGKRRS